MCRWGSVSDTQLAGLPNQQLDGELRYLAMLFIESCSFQLHLAGSEAVGLRRETGLRSSHGAQAVHDSRVDPKTGR